MNANTLITGAKACLFENGRAYIQLGGTSMHPRFREGQSVEIAEIKNHSSIARGWPYVYVRENRLIMHRVLAVCGSHAIMAGDNVLVLEQIPIRSIIGKWVGSQDAFFTLSIRCLDTILLLLPCRRLFMRIRRVCIQYWSDKGANS
jgi:hypothetical protein